MPSSKDETAYEIAERVDPNTSNDVCTFCRHAREVSFERGVDCGLGHSGYFRSLSQYGPIYVSNCEVGELRPELAALEKKRQPKQPLHPDRESA